MNLIYHADFTGMSDTTADARPGGTAGVGEDWADVVGGKYLISGGKLMAPTAANDIYPFMRPAFETTANTMVRIQFTPGAYPPNGPRLFARYNPGRKHGIGTLFDSAIPEVAFYRGVYD